MSNTLTMAQESTPLNVSSFFMVEFSKHVYEVDQHLFTALKSANITSVSKCERRHVSQATTLVVCRYDKTTLNETVHNNDLRAYLESITGEKVYAEPMSIGQSTVNEIITKSYAVDAAVPRPTDTTCTIC